MEACFHLKIPFDTRCNFAGLYQVMTAPALVAVSVYSKMERELNASKLMEFVERIKSKHKDIPAQKTPQQIQEEQKVAEKARAAAERANAFLRHRNNAQAQVAAA